MDEDARTPREPAVVLKERIENAAADGDVNNYLESVQMVEDMDLPGEHAHALVVAIEEGQERIVTMVTNAVVSAKVKLEHDAAQVLQPVVEKSEGEATTEPTAVQVTGQEPGDQPPAGEQTVQAETEQNTDKQPVEPSKGCGAGTGIGSDKE